MGFDVQRFKDPPHHFPIADGGTSGDLVTTLGLRAVVHQRQRGFGQVFGVNRLAKSAA